MTHTYYIDPKTRTVTEMNVELGAGDDCVILPLGGDDIMVQQNHSFFDKGLHPWHFGGLRMGPAVLIFSEPQPDLSDRVTWIGTLMVLNGSIMAIPSTR